ncbi:IS110 family transposase [Desulfotruncus alcoholivorax]|uniref:IS110 family transposase n=1 Tax=Desulfotruncus alcoholivorax TaxID=265477 RepID=UPI00040542A2|nr:IS110 family transposase [Desulfotruncus alcoholivorax]
MKLVEPYQQQISLILTIPGIKDIYTAIAIIGEIGTDMSVFQSSRHLCSWAGLTPRTMKVQEKRNLYV